MSNIPVPERGQPLDLTYIYQIARTVNQLSLQSSFSANRFASIDVPGTQLPRQDIKVTDSRIVAGYKEVTSSTATTQETSVPFFYDFPAADFKYPPIVTATPVNVSGTETGRDVVIVLKQATTSRVEGIVRFGVAGNSTIGINIIAIGVPN
jgi:hypothetical protein